MESMDFHEVFSALQSTGETDRIEAKSAVHGIGKSFLETVCAFSNEPGLGGGYIVLGVKREKDTWDSKYVVTGISNPDQLQNDIASQCKQCFNIPIRPTVKVVQHPQGCVLLVCVSEVNPHEKPVYLRSKGLEQGAYRRLGSSDQVCTREDIDYLYQLRSKLGYDETLLEEASLDEFDPKAIKLYRDERQKIKPDATELRYNDQDLLKAIRAIRTEKGATLPTVGGILLFGNQMVLHRLFGISSRVDYMLIEGREWATSPERRYTALEMCESLITGIPRLIAQIMNDIPQVFALEEDQLRRKYNPIIPRNVIREAVVNALMHKDYRVGSSTQIIRYSNRTEFRNVGYSLKPPEQLGLPGSMTRNLLISQVLRDIHYAEDKGTGIGTMREEMRNANLSVPLIESSRASNAFVLTLLPHHLFNAEDIEWLKGLKDYNLTDEEARTLVILRQKGSISNAEYRTINGVETLVASAHLRRLRDLGLLEQRGSGNTTFYVPTAKLLIAGIVGQSSSMKEGGSSMKEGGSSMKGGGSSMNEGGSSMNEGGSSMKEGGSSMKEGTSESPVDFSVLSKRVIESLENVRRKDRPQKTKEAIAQLCAVKPLKLSELAEILSLRFSHLSNFYIARMIEAGDLEYLFPEYPNHPEQAYRTKKPQ